MKLTFDLDGKIIFSKELSEEAKKVVIDLANQIEGVRAIDCGNLEKSRIIEAITPLLIALNIKYKSKGTGIRITNLGV